MTAKLAADERQKVLEKLYLGGVQNSNGQSLSVETLLDVLVSLYDECSSSTLRREKTVTDFVEYSKIFYFSTDFLLNGL